MPRPALVTAVLCLALACVACGDAGAPSPTPGGASPSAITGGEPTPDNEPASAASAPWLVYSDAAGLLRYNPEDGARQGIGDACPQFTSIVGARAGGAWALRCQSQMGTSITIWKDDAVVARRDIDPAGFGTLISFSADGSHYAYLVSGAGEARDLVYGEVRVGAEPQQHRDVEFAYAWAPVGDRLAFCAITDGGCALTITDAGFTNAGPHDVRPLGWSDGARSRILGAQGFQDAPDLAIDRYEAVLLDLQTGERTRVPALDDAQQLWFSPSGRYAARTRYDEAAQLIRVEVVELATGEARTIPASRISYPSEGIPQDHIRFEGDETIWWVESAPSTIYRAPLGTDGAAETVVSLATHAPQISPDFRRVAYTTFDETTRLATLRVANIDGTDAVEITQAPGERPSSFAWVAP
jgi:hypothetical protein